MNPIFNSNNRSIFDVQTKSAGPQGEIPFSPETLIEKPSGHHFGMTQNVGMGWSPQNLSGKQILILSTQGGMRSENGQPVALGYHSGHFEVSMLVKAAAEQLSSLGHIPFAGFCSDPCDGRTQGTDGMFDSLAYRNDAAILFKRLIRSLPTRDGVLGIATCDKGLPAMMMALVSNKSLPAVLVPGGVTLPPIDGEDLGKIQSIGARYAQGEVSLDYAREASCRSCASPGGGCHFLGTAATSQVIGEALGLSLTHSALAPSGQDIWLDTAKRSAIALLALVKNNNIVSKIISQDSIYNAMVLLAAFGGSSNLLLHIPAIAFSAGLSMPDLNDWIDVNKNVPRLVDVNPNGPVGFPTIQAFLAGGVPEVMLHLRDLGLLKLGAKTVTGLILDENLDWWKTSERRQKLRDLLSEKDGIDPDMVIMNPTIAKDRGLKSTFTFPTGNLAPDGSVIKSTSIDPSVVDSSGIYTKIGEAQVFTKEKNAIRAIKSGILKPGHILVLICTGPMGSGMEETFQITAALKHLSYGKHIAVLTDGRFSGVSTGACIGHIGPEALAGGPIGKVLDGDVIEIKIDRNTLIGTVNLMGGKNTPAHEHSVDRGSEILSNRPLRDDLKSQENLPDDTKLWAALQNVSGGTWKGCVYDTAKILSKLNKSIS
jgi:xylonate dehydratase